MTVEALHDDDYQKYWRRAEVVAVDPERHRVKIVYEGEQWRQWVTARDGRGRKLRRWDAKKEAQFQAKRKAATKKELAVSPLRFIRLSWNVREHFTNTRMFEKLPERP